MGSPTPLFNSMGGSAPLPRSAPPATGLLQLWDVLTAKSPPKLAETKSSHTKSYAAKTHAPSATAPTAPKPPLGPGIGAYTPQQPERPHTLTT